METDPSSETLCSSVKMSKGLKPSNPEPFRICSNCYAFTFLGTKATFIIMFEALFAPYLTSIQLLDRNNIKSSVKEKLDRVITQAVSCWLPA
jgi:hypothetical protein